MHRYFIDNKCDHVSFDRFMKTDNATPMKIVEASNTKVGIYEGCW